MQLRMTSNPNPPSLPPQCWSCRYAPAHSAFLRQGLTSRCAGLELKEIHWPLFLSVRIKGRFHHAQSRSVFTSHFAQIYTDAQIYMSRGLEMAQGGESQCSGKHEDLSTPPHKKARKAVCNNNPSRVERGRGHLRSWLASQPSQNVKLRGESETLSQNNQVQQKNRTPDMLLWPPHACSCECAATITHTVIWSIKSASPPLEQFRVSSPNVQLHQINTGNYNTDPFNSLKSTLKANETINSWETPCKPYSLSSNLNHIPRPLPVT